jgi:hypothetical protein
MVQQKKRQLKQQNLESQDRLTILECELKRRLLRIEDV